MSLESMTLPVRPYGSGYGYTGELWTCSATGDLSDGRRLTEQVDEASVSIDWNGEVKSTMRLVMRTPVSLRPLYDYLMPMISIHWHDELGHRKEILEPLGVFNFLMPDMNLDRAYTSKTFECNDNLWILSQLTTDEMHWVDTNRDYGSAVRGILTGRTRVPLSLPDTGRFPVTPVTVRQYEPALEKANELYISGGFYDLAAGRRGIVTTSKQTIRGRGTIKRELITRDILGPISVLPDRNGFYNEVFMASSDPDAGDELAAGIKMSFTDPDRPMSTSNIPVVTQPIFDAHDETMNELRYRAYTMLQAAAGLDERIIVPHIPDPRFDIREDWSLDVDQDDGANPIQGNYQVEGMEFGLTPDAAIQITTLSRIVNTDYFFRANQ